MFGEQLRAASIAVRTGSRGWDDYVLLASCEEPPDAPAKKANAPRRH